MTAWIHALESGDYIQGTAYMAAPEGLQLDPATLLPINMDEPLRYCCWGVAGEVAVQRHLASKTRNPRTGSWSFAASTDDGDGSAVLPTVAVKTLFGVDESTSTRLVEMNDSKFSTTHRDFNGIAAYLREKYNITD